MTVAKSPELYLSQLQKSVARAPGPFSSGNLMLTHRRGAENAGWPIRCFARGGGAEVKDRFSLRNLCVLCASAVNSFPVSTSESEN